jgi:putative FmdB family regulatory protein
MIMPIYDYKCTKCEYTDELIRSLSEKKEFEMCPECGGNMTHQLGVVSHRYKGFGWSVDGYQSGESMDQKNNRAQFKDQWAERKPSKTGELAPNVKEKQSKMTVTKG